MATRLLERAPIAVASILTVAIPMLAIIGGCSRSSTAPMAVLAEDEAAESHRKMIAELELVAEEAKQTNEYFNSESRMERARRALSNAIASNDTVGELEGSKSLGILELNAGNSAEAAKLFVKACDLIPIVEKRRLAMIPESSKENLYLSAATAFLRQAEDENCVHCTDGTACILPFAKEAIHQKRTGSEKAIEYFERVLEVNDRNASAVWLMNLAAMSLGEYPERIPEEFRIPEERFASDANFPKFQNIAHGLGLDTLSHAGGVIVDDFDGDHQLDILVSNWHPSGQIQFFHNNGDGSFSNRTEDANLTGITGGLNIVHADYDNDGDIDVYVLRGAWLTPEVGSYPNSLLQNDGSGRFQDVTFAVGLGDEHHPTQTAAWSDFDNDGDLDLFVGNEDARGQLYRNDGGRFTDIAVEAGVSDSRGVAKAVAWGDYNSDGYADLYISNLHHANLLFQNNRDGTFRDVSRSTGVSDPTDSFACWFWDYNNDGNLDLFVGSYAVGVQHIGLDYLGVGTYTDMDCLYENQGDGVFREVALDRGLSRVTQPMGSNYGDLDNDGRLDFYLGTGYPGYDALMPNVMYRNVGDDGFEDVTFAGGFGHLQKGHAVAFADFDNDGDQDIFQELGGAYNGDAFHDALYENPGFGNHWIKIRLWGVESNRSAIGARIKLTFNDGGETRNIYRWISAGSSFGGNPLRQEIGLGNAEKIDELEVFWPKSGTTQTFQDINSDQFLVITEGDDDYETIPLTQVTFDVATN